MQVSPQLGGLPSASESGHLHNGSICETMRGDVPVIDASESTVVEVEPPSFADFSAPLLAAAGPILADADVDALVARALADGEVRQAGGGPLVASTAPFTGRSAQDKYLVRDAEHEADIWWHGNQAMEPEVFARLRNEVLDYVRGRPLFVQNLAACADAAQRLAVRVITERAWHGLFIRHLLRQPDDPARAGRGTSDFTVISLPGFRANPDRLHCRSETVVALSFRERLAIIVGTGYAGEIKKTVFTILNHMLPGRGVMSMHCSANHAPDDPSQSAVFFGLSGTGKTTLSNAGDRTLIGDDEHGWYRGKLFNIEGGCYAKTYRLSAEGEPVIYRAANSYGTVLENVAVDSATGAIDFNDSSITENGRCAYSLESIAGASPTGVAGDPRQVVMLTCDAFSVLPPLSRLTPQQAVYHFLSGFTAKVAGTERGLTEPAPTFSACFAKPFLTRPPEVYGRLLRERIEDSGASCWLLNTGWLGGGPGVGQRMPLAMTRALLSSVLSGAAEEASMRRDPLFGFDSPVEIPGLDSTSLDPREAWNDPASYNAAAARLVGMFRDNFREFEDGVDEDVRSVSPGAT